MHILPFSSHWSIYWLPTAQSFQGGYLHEKSPFHCPLVHVLYWDVLAKIPSNFQLTKARGHVSTSFSASHRRSRPSILPFSLKHFLLGFSDVPLSWFFPGLSFLMASDGLPQRVFPTAQSQALSFLHLFFFLKEQLLKVDDEYMGFYYIISTFGCIRVSLIKSYCNILRLFKKE